MKKIKGFTLIELIVVIAIIGILATILIPSMMGWVTKARITSYNSDASEICTQLQTMLTDLSMENNMGEFENCEILYSNGSFNSSFSADSKNKLEEINASLADISKGEWAARIVDGTVRAVVVTRNNGSCVGGFPVQCPNNAKYKMKTIRGVDDYISCAIGGVSGSTWDDLAG